MKFLVYKQVDTNDAGELAGYMDAGFTVQRIKKVNAGEPMRAIRKAEGGVAVKRRRRRRKTRTPLKVTPELVQQMTALREKGLIWRIVGKRFGVSGTRAWQICKQGV